MVPAASPSSLTRSFERARRLTAGALLLFLPWSIAPAQDTTATPQPSFRFTPEAGKALRALWNSSVAAKQERAACLGAVVKGDSVLVDRVLPLGLEGADSMGISAQESIDTCGPPQWSGTVHTHVALYTEDAPSKRFSGQDRIAMSLWYDRWHADGVFCVVWSERDAHCEADGVVGGMRSRARPRPVH
jgi:hypothetical protein